MLRPSPIHGTQRLPNDDDDDDDDDDVAVSKLQVAILARLAREMSQTVLIG